MHERERTDDDCEYRENVDRRHRGPGKHNWPAAHSDKLELSTMSVWNMHCPKLERLTGFYAHFRGDHFRVAAAIELIKALAQPGERQPRHGPEPQAGEPGGTLLELRNSCAEHPCLLAAADEYAIKALSACELGAQRAGCVCSCSAHEYG